MGGSIVLAGVLLKLGSYGLTIMLPFIMMRRYLIFYFSMSILGSIISSLICIRQGDIKLFVAYSSIVHIGVVNLGLIRGTELGYERRLIMIISHGLRSPFLFLYSYWLYENSHSRLILNNTRTLPLFIFSIIALVSLNMGVPPRLRV